MLSVLFPNRLRSDVPGDVADTRTLDGRLKIEFKPRIAVVQTTKRGTKLFFHILRLFVV